MGDRHFRTGRSERDGLFFDAAPNELTGEVEIDAAGSSAHRLAQGQVDQFGDAFGAIDLGGPLAARACKGDLVGFLEAAEPARSAINRASKDDEGHAGLRRDVEASDGVDHAGA